MPKRAKHTTVTCQDAYMQAPYLTKHKVVASFWRQILLLLSNA